MIDFHNHVLPGADDGAKDIVNGNQYAENCEFSRYYRCGQYHSFSASKDGGKEC